VRAVVQRVNKACVKTRVEALEEISGEIGYGLLVLLGVMLGDTQSQAEFLAKKIAELRIFCDADDKMNLSVIDLNAEILVVSNFTLGADCKKGRRPYFSLSEKPEQANILYEYFVECLMKNEDINKVATGKFGEHMEIEITCNGPVTIILDTDEIYTNLNANKYLK